ncbi:brachyurin [Tribolium castaneum]|uniref:brachyurin n=1 Tax=Tribolium castaneum TaxID=7070 RepID=UPI0030FEA2DE
MKLICTLCLFLVYTWTSSAKQITNSRIIGGITAFAGQFPFAVAIETTTKDGKYFCGGTLLNDQWIITAAQCADGALLFSIQIGATSLSDPDENRLVLATSEYVLHPEYDPATLKNDIALIELRIPIQFSNYILPIHGLPEAALEAGVRVVALGWGQTSDEDAGLSDKLKFVTVTSLTNDECRLVYGNQITDQMVCVEGNYNEGSCKGDTGSPLVRVISLGNALLIGVASFVSGNGCESTDPSGYTRISPYVDWIANVTNYNTTKF